MGKIINKLFSLVSFLMVATGCAIAVPEVAKLASIDTFSSKSDSPFEQENPNKSVRFAGTCLPGVTGFEFRLNEHTVWTPVPGTAPAPNVSEYEYVLPGAVYDLDCSDGSFDFYLFITTVMQNFGGPNPIDVPGDPRRIEIRPVGVPGLPSIVYERPRAASLRMDSREFGSFRGQLIAGSAPIRIELRLVTSEGRRAEVVSGETFNVNLSLENMTKSGNPTGLLRQIVEGNCAAMNALLSPTITILPGQDSFSFCYDPAGALPNETIRILARKADLVDGEFTIQIHPPYSVASALHIQNASGYFPQSLIRNAEYEFKLDLFMLGYGPGSIDSFVGGTYRVYASDPTILMRDASGSTGCATTWQAGYIECTTINYNNMPRIKLLVSPTHPRDQFNVRLEVVKPSPCNTSNCSIFNSASLYTIGNILPNQIFFGVSGGTLTFDRPLVEIRHRNSIRLNECTEAYIAAGNAENVSFPLPLSIPNLNIGLSTAGTLASFYSDNYCSSPNQLAVTPTFALSNATAPIVRFWLRVNTMPSSGCLEVYTSESVYGRNNAQIFFVEGGGSNQ